METFSLDEIVKFINCFDPSETLLITSNITNINKKSFSILNLILIGKYYEQYSFDSLRLITYGTERMPQTLLNRLKNTFPRIKFLQTLSKAFEI